MRSAGSPSAPIRRHDVLGLLDVVGPLDVEDPIEPASQLLPVIRDVGKSVGRLAGRLHQHAVLRPADRREAEPDRAVLVVDEPGRAERLESAVDLPLGVEQSLVRVDVEANAEPLERPSDVGEDAVLRRLAEDALVAVARQRVSVPGAKIGRDLPDVVALVAVLGKRRRLAQSSRYRARTDSPSTRIWRPALLK
jgi:hypothetical protein